MRCVQWALVVVVVALLTVGGNAGSADGSLQDASKLPTLAASDLKDVLTVTDGVWLVLVGSTDCGEGCELARELLTKAQAKAGEIMSFAYMDARGPLVNDKGEETVVALEFNITQVPALLYYSYGPKKVVPSHVISAELVASLIGRGLKPFLRLLRNFLPSRVSQVKELGMNKFLTFDTPELQRVLLVTKKKLSPMPYDRLSLQFERRAVFGYTSPSNEVIMTKLGLEDNDVPALFISPVGKTLDVDDDMSSWTRYDKGSMSYGHLAAWLHAQTSRVPVPLINDPSVFERCKGTGGVWFIAFLPDEDWKQGFDIMQRVSERVYVLPNIVAGKFTTESLPVHFAWAQADHQPAVRKTLDLDFVPSVVAVNPRKGVFAKYVGPFSEPDLHEFVVSTIMHETTLEDMVGELLFRTVDSPQTKQKAKKSKKKSKKAKRKSKKKSKKSKGKKRKQKIRAKDEL